MRYTCERCGGWVKDKFFFGLWHFCLTDEEVAARQYRQIWGHLGDGPPPEQQVPSLDHFSAGLRSHLDASITGRESASQDVAHRDTREGLERSATELREQAEADAKRIFGGLSTTRDRE